MPPCCWGSVGFPLLFETQPRPVAIDIPIEIPRKDGAPALVLPPAVTAPAAAPAAKVASVPAEIVERSADEGRELAASAPALKPSAKSTPKPASAASLVPAKPLPAAPKPADDGGRARAVPVQIEHNNGSAAEVRSGLTEGQSVIVHPPDAVAEGKPVSPR